MSSLTMTLIVLMVVTLVVVAIFNVLQMSRGVRAQPKELKPSALMPSDSSDIQQNVIGRAAVDSNYRVDANHRGDAKHRIEPTLNFTDRSPAQYSEGQSETLSLEDGFNFDDNQNDLDKRASLRPSPSKTVKKELLIVGDEEVLIDSTKPHACITNTPIHEVDSHEAESHEAENDEAENDEAKRICSVTASETPQTLASCPVLPAKIEPSVSGSFRSEAARINPLSDCIVEIKLAPAQSIDRLIGLTRSFRRVGAKPVLFEAWVTDHATSRWAPLVPTSQAALITKLHVGVLLANRHGPLNAMEYAEFSTGITSLASQLNAKIELPLMADVLERARKLDDICIELDAQIGLNIDANEPLNPNEMERLAREQRLVERGNNRYARLGPCGEVIFSIAQIDHPNRVTFLLDVPRAPSECDPWHQLVACAQGCSMRLQGTLVDDAGRPLPPKGLDQIGKALAIRHQELEAAGITAGSPLALRLFN